MVVFGQATGAIHVSIVDLILPETPCFPFGAFRHSGQMHFLIRYAIYLSILIFPVIPSECFTSYLLCSRIRNRLGILEFGAAPGPLFRSLPTECTRIAIVELLTSSGTLIQHNQVESSLQSSFLRAWPPYASKPRGRAHTAAALGRPSQAQDQYSAWPRLSTHCSRPAVRARPC